MIVLTGEQWGKEGASRGVARAAAGHPGVQGAPTTENPPAPMSTGQSLETALFLGSRAQAEEMYTHKCTFFFQSAKRELKIVFVTYLI